MKKITLVFFYLMLIGIISGCSIEDQAQNNILQNQQKTIPIEKSEKTNTLITQCVNDYNQQYKNSSNDYAKSKILISFIKGITEQDARTTVSAHGLSIDKIGNRFSDNPWALINVPSGEEIKWICKISQDEKIESAELNTILSAY